MELKAEKKALRKQIKETLAALSKEEIARQSMAVCEKVEAMDVFKKAKTVLTYMAMPKECDPQYIDFSGKTVAYPLCVEGGRLEVYVPLGEDSFARGAYGITEPVPSKCTKLEPKELDLVIVPCVAYDKTCKRMGHGVGYYDRLLSETDAATVGIALNQQVVDSVPAEEWDKKVDYVIAENGIYCK